MASKGESTRTELTNSPRPSGKPATLKDSKIESPMRGHFECSFREAEWKRLIHFRGGPSLQGSNKLAGLSLGPSHHVVSGAPQGPKDKGAIV